jgi:hypothetical protein
MNSTGWVGKQGTERSAGPLPEHSPVPSPSSYVSTNLRGETPAFAIYSKRPVELSKQLLTLVEKTQFF